MVKRLRMHRLIKKVHGTYRYYLTDPAAASSPLPFNSARPASYRRWP